MQRKGFACERECKGFAYEQGSSTVSVMLDYTKRDGYWIREPGEEPWFMPATYTITRPLDEDGNSEGVWVVYDPEITSLFRVLGEIVASQAPAETSSLPESVRALQGWLRRAAAEVNDYGTEGNEDLYDALERGAEQLEVVLDVLGQYLSDSVKDVDAMLKPPRFSVSDLHGTPVVWEVNECDGQPDPRPLSLLTIAKMLNERTLSEAQRVTMRRIIRSYFPTSSARSQIMFDAIVAELSAWLSEGAPPNTDA